MVSIYPSKRNDANQQSQKQPFPWVILHPFCGLGERGKPTDGTTPFLEILLVEILSPIFYAEVSICGYTLVVSTHIKG
jgi:hypothetical protein